MSLQQPGWLVLLLVLPLLATGAALVAHSRARQWSAFVAPRLRTKLLRRSSPVPRWIAFTCLLLATALLIIALARPVVRRGAEKEDVLGRNVLFAIDLSRSMKVADLSPDRLTQAKTVCYDLLDAMPTDRVGVVGFAGTAYRFVPLTVDHANVRETISQLDIDWIPTGGSNLEAGLSLSIETLKETGSRQNALILLSDGEEHEGKVASLAAEARDAGIEVITIGFGTSEGDFVPDRRNPERPLRDREGREVISRLEPAPLQRLATVTGGRFAIASSGNDIPAMVQAAISDLERIKVAGTQHVVTVEYYQWFLLPAILLMIGAVVAATRWRGVGQWQAAVPLLIGLLAGAPIARGSDFDDARKALASERFADAAAAFGALADESPDTQEGFRFRLAQGEAAYRMKDWATARQAFSEALRSEESEVRHAAHHGLGNALFEIGWQRVSKGLNYPETDEEETGTDVAEVFRRMFDALLGRDEDGEEPEPEELAEFEAMVKRRISEWLTESQASETPGSGSERFQSLITDWIDAVKHYDAAPGVPEAAHNRELTVKHLRKLREILEDIQESAQSMQAIPQSGEGPPNSDSQPQEGEGEGDGENQGKGGGDQEEGDGKQGDHPSEDDGSDRKRDPNARPQEPKEPENDGSKQPKPGETPEEAARRILEENADLQKGALSPGGVRFRRPEKDW